jgi:hypothetical protein
MKLLRVILCLLVAAVALGNSWPLPPVGPTGATGAAGAGSCVSVTLSSADIKALDLTAKTILASQGPNAVIAPTLLFIQYKFGTVAYTIGSNAVSTIHFLYGSVVGTNSFEIFNETPGSVALFTAAADRSSPLVAVSGLNEGSLWSAGTVIAKSVAPTIFKNQPIAMGIPTADASTLNTGPITTLTVADCSTCTGYVANDTFTIDALGALPDTSDATGHVVTAAAGKAVTVAVNTAGVSYPITTANPNTGPYPTAHTSGTGNNALTVNVTGATVGDGTAIVTMCYNVVTLQ